MKLLTQMQHWRLKQNGIAQAHSGGTIDTVPVVKLFTPDANCTWLLAEIDPEDPDIAFGLCDLGMQCPELGSVRISELEGVHGRLGLSIERDLSWKAKGTLGAYADAARKAGCIVQLDGVGAA